jgi:hypothetical protein
VPAERVHVLTDCRVRFSQRSAFDDDHELQPDYAAFGTSGEIWRFIIGNAIQLDRRIPANVLVQLIAQSPKAQALAMQTMLKNSKAVNEVGVFCLTEAADCDRMWRDYADNGRGFVIAFDTTHAEFVHLKVPGRIGKVTYSDELLETFLGTMETEGAAVLFRKRMKYAFEREWRTIRFLQRLERHPGGVYLTPFSPASVHAIIVRPECRVNTELRRLVDTDARYNHAQIVADAARTGSARE